VTGERLDAWLTTEMLSAKGIQMLTARLHSLYGDTLPVIHARSLAFEVLRSSSSRAAKSLVRATIYSNWRAANRDSISGDLLPDMHHILTAGYCSVYATAEQGQMAYAKLLLTNHTKIAVYDAKFPIDKWLLGWV
jgi:hypothetical protein